MKDLTSLKFKEIGEFNNLSGNTVVANLSNQEKVIEVVKSIGLRILI